MAYELITLYVEVVDDGRKRRAIRVKDNTGHYCWLPKSQIRKSVHLGQRSYRLVIPRWLADQKGLI